MMKNILIISPHPDDETLGCGGTILKHKHNKNKVHYLLATNLLDNKNVSSIDLKNYSKQINNMKSVYKFDSFKQLNFPATSLDTIVENNIIHEMNACIKKIKPNIVYLPFPGDIHSDHRKVFNMASSCTKSFRNPFIEEVVLYEVLSETNFSINPTIGSFKPNLYENITKFFEKKIKFCSIFKSEFKAHPFPRSKDSVKSLAKLRGSESSFKYAEAFMIIKKIKK